MISSPLQSHYAWSLIMVTVAGVIALTVNLQTGFFVLVFALLAWWVWEHEELALLSFIALAPLLPMLKITQTIGTFTLAKDVLIVTLFFKVCLLPLLQQKMPYRRNIVFLPLLFLLGWLVVTLLTADSLILGILRARDVGLYILLYFAVLYMKHDTELLKRRLIWLVSSGAVLLLAGLYQYFWAGDSAVLRFDPVRSIWIPRISSTFAHPTVFGEYVVLLSSLAAALLIKSKRWRWWALGGSVLLLPFIYLTYSRGVWLGYVIGLTSIGIAAGWQTFMGHASQSKIWPRLLGVAVGVLLIFLLLVQFTPVGTFIQASLDPAYASNRIRLDFVARLVGATTNTEAVFGHGLGDISQKVIKSVELEAVDIAQTASRDVQLAKDSTLVDNQYLKTFIEMGLVGLLIYAWIYARVIKYSWNLYRGSYGEYKQVLGLAALGFFISFVVQGLFVDIWDVFPTNALFWIMAALISYHSLTKSTAGDNNQH